MNNLLFITTNEQGLQIVSARELHAFLGATERFSNWFDRQLQFGFIENQDYVGCKVFNALANQELNDFALTLDCAKEISMVQRTEKGQQARRYFIEVERVAKQQQSVSLPTTYKEALQALLVEVEEKERLQLENAELRPKAEYAAQVLASDAELTTTLIAKELGKSAVWLNKKLQELRVQYNQGGIWVLYQSYADKGYATLRTYLYADTGGRSHTKHYLVWTEAGRRFIHERLNPKLSPQQSLVVNYTTAQA